MKRILVIVNPAADSGRAGRVLEKIKALAVRHQECCSYDYMVTEHRGHATDLARENAALYDLVAVLGGDGTINEVVNGLVAGDTPLGVIPSGTGNDFVRSADIPRDPWAAIDLLCRGEPEPIDLGLVNGRYFVNAVGIGFDGRANYEAQKITWIKGSLVFVAAIIKTIWSWKAVPLTLKIDGITVVEPDQPTYLVGIGNGWSIGGGLKLTPQARLDSNTLHVIHVADINPLKILFNFIRLITGSLEKLKEVTIYSGQTITVRSEQPQPAHADGEVLGMEVRNLEVELLPADLEVIRVRK